MSSLQNLLIALQKHFNAAYIFFWTLPSCLKSAICKWKKKNNVWANMSLSSSLGDDRAGVHAWNGYICLVAYHCPHTDPYSSSDLKWIWMWRWHCLCPSKVPLTAGTFQLREQLSASLLHLTWERQKGEEGGTARGLWTLPDLHCPDEGHQWLGVKVRLTINSKRWK